MTMDTGEGAPAEPPGRTRKLRGLWGSLAHRWPRRLRPRLPRLKWWQWAIVGVVALTVGLWMTTTANSTSIHSATVLVTDGRHGIAPPESLFDFGDLPQGASIEHELTLKNDGWMDSYVAIMIYGEIRDLIEIKDAFFVLKSGQERTIPVKLTVPPSAEVDKRYDGRVFVVQTPWWVPQ